MGYWKGSSFAFMLDILGAVLTDGIGAADIDNTGKGSCGRASQVFIIIDPSQIIEYNKMVSLPERKSLISRAPSWLKTRPAFLPLAKITYCTARIRPKTAFSWTMRFGKPSNLCKEGAR